MKKKRIVLNDKDKIAAVIKELDEKKNEALRNAWRKVNKVNLFPAYGISHLNFVITTEVLKRWSTNLFAVANLLIDLVVNCRVATCTHKQSGNVPRLVL